MHSDMIGKIEKARVYATEPERLQIHELSVIFRGENSTHQISLSDGIWHHDHEDDHQISPHVMALQRILAPMLPAAAQALAEEPGVPMYSNVIGKIEKARIYANEPERITIQTLRATFRGSNGTHVITLDAAQQWSCDCEFFLAWGTCQHVMATRKILEPMLSPEALQNATFAASPYETVSV